MCSTCLAGKDGHPRATARGQLNVLAAVLIVAAGAASAAVGLASLLGHEAARGAPVPKSADVLELPGPDLGSGRSLSAALRGRAVIVEFWSSACPGCRRVAESLKRLARDRSVAIVGVDVGDTVAGSRALVRRLGWRYFSGADPGARFAKAVGLRKLPTTLLLDRRHRVVLQVTGAQSLATLDKQVELLH